MRTLLADDEGFQEEGEMGGTVRMRRTAGAAALEDYKGHHSFSFMGKKKTLLS